MWSVIPANERANRLTNRMLLEYCCGPESRLGDPKYSNGGCIIVRLPSDIDMRSESGIDMRSESGIAYALEQVERAHQDGLRVSVWASLPCMAGTLWFWTNRKF